MMPADDIRLIRIYASDTAHEDQEYHPAHLLVDGGWRVRVPATWNIAGMWKALIIILVPDTCGTENWTLNAAAPIFQGDGQQNYA